MAHKHYHSRKGKHFILLTKIGAGLLIVLLLCTLAWKNKTINSRLVSAFGNNEKLQKDEYNKQKAMAAKKYGTSGAKQNGTKETSKKKSVVSSDTEAKVATQESVSTKTSKAEKNISSTGYTTYVVQSGDYLSTIASDYGTTVQELVELNDLESSRVAAGQVLKVPAKTDANTSSLDVNSDSQSVN